MGVVVAERRRQALQAGQQHGTTLPEGEDAPAHRRRPGGAHRGQILYLPQPGDSRGVRLNPGGEPVAGEGRQGGQWRSDEVEAVPAPQVPRGQAQPGDAPTLLRAAHILEPEPGGAVGPLLNPEAARRPQALGQRAQQPGAVDGYLAALFHRAVRRDDFEHGAPGLGRARRASRDAQAVHPALGMEGARQRLYVPAQGRAVRGPPQAAGQLANGPGVDFWGAVSVHRSQRRSGCQKASFGVFHSSVGANRPPPRRCSRMTSRFRSTPSPGFSGTRT